MPLFFELRTSLKTLLSGHQQLSNDATINPVPVAEIAKTLESGELPAMSRAPFNRLRTDGFTFPVAHMFV
jgi:hypothetical protein